MPPAEQTTDRLLRRFDPVERYGLRLTLFAVALLLVAVPFGLLLAQVVTDGPATRWDTSIAESLHRWVAGREGIVTLMQAVSFLGKPIWLAVVIGLPALWLASQRRWHLAWFLVITAIGGGIVDTVAKVAIGRPRPELEAPVASAFGNSFPSGHAMSSTVCYGALLLAFASLLRPAARRWATAAVVVLVLAIGVTRLALGVHYVTDVLGGFVLGLAWLAGSVAVWEIWREDRGLRRTDPLEEGVEPEDLVEAGRHPAP
ncbi:MAG: phosphatase PAP2 family protein [Acidimicrobiales bacterium]